MLANASALEIGSFGCIPMQVFIFCTWAVTLIKLISAKFSFKQFRVMNENASVLLNIIYIYIYSTLLVERPCLRCQSSKETDAMKVRLRSHDHSRTNSKHAYTEDSVTNLKMCHGESEDNFWLPYIQIYCTLVFRSVTLVINPHSIPKLSKLQIEMKLVVPGC
jgi:hypothetical protein